jgi:hypothetical protein
VALEDVPAAQEKVNRIIVPMPVHWVVELITYEHSHIIQKYILGSQIVPIAEWIPRAEVRSVIRSSRGTVILTLSAQQNAIPAIHQMNLTALAPALLKLFSER